MSEHELKIRKQACKCYINIQIKKIKNNELISEWNKGQLHAYELLLMVLDSKNADYSVNYALNECELIRNNPYSKFNSGMYEAMRTYSTISISEVTLKYKTKRLQ